MTTANVYLTFDGNCEEAFNFYKSVLGGEFSYMGRFKDMPPTEGVPPVSDADGERIMHVSLPISKETILQGSDSASDWGPKLQVGNNFSVSITATSKTDADRFFAELSEGGKITMAMSKTFWGSYFGSFSDKFGINWMISFNENPAHQ
jgi:PhnB protein